MRRAAEAGPGARVVGEQRAAGPGRGLIEPVKVMYAESMRLSARWAAEFRGFWDLPEDFQFEAVTPTVAADRAEPGKITPEETADEFLASSEVETVEPPRGGGVTLDRETLAAMLDEKLSRREVKDIQSGYKDPDRFEKWVAVLQERVPYDEPIVLPMGEGLNVRQRGRRARRPLRLRPRLLPADAQLEDGGGDVRSRRPRRSCSRSTPRWPTATPSGWSCASSTAPPARRQLETEAVPPGYPVVHEFLPDIEGFYRGWLGREVP